MSDYKIFVKLFFIFFIFNFQLALGQNSNISENQIDNIAACFETLKNSNDENIRIVTAKKIDSLFIVLLNDENSFNDSLFLLKKYASLLSSDDKKIRIITWNNYFSDGSFKYYGYVQFFDQNGDFYFEKLTDKSEEIENPQSKNLTPQNWFGCLYYQIITVKAPNGTFYTLLGWDGNNFRSNKKIIEVFNINNGDISFGYPFEIQHNKQKRIIFEYTKQATMSLSWNPSEKMIIWEHLAPEKPKFEGIYEYYGPDMTYDALKLKKGKWIFVENLKK